MEAKHRNNFKYYWIVSLFDGLATGLWVQEVLLNYGQLRHKFAFQNFPCLLFLYHSQLSFVFHFIFFLIACNDFPSLLWIKFYMRVCVDVTSHDKKSNNTKFVVPSIFLFVCYSVPLLDLTSFSLFLFINKVLPFHSSTLNVF